MPKKRYHTGVRLKDLRKHHTYKKHILLYCEECGAEVSANPSDYFSATEEDVFKHCDQPMVLVEKITTYKELKR